jgi:hypothetical protein
LPCDLHAQAAVGFWRKTEQGGVGKNGKTDNADATLWRELLSLLCDIDLRGRQAGQPGDMIDNALVVKSAQ